MAEDRDRRHVMRRVEEVRALRTPARQQILAAIQHLGPCSAAELAVHIGWKPASLYYHLQVLSQVGLIVEVERRRRGRREESVYQARARELVLDPEERSPEYLAAVAETYRAALRVAERNLERALGGEQGGSGPRRDTAVYHLRVRLTDPQVEEVCARLAELCETVAAEDDADASDSFLLTIAWSKASDGGA